MDKDIMTMIPNDTSTAIDEKEQPKREITLKSNDNISYNVAIIQGKDDIIFTAKKLGDKKVTLYKKTYPLKEIQKTNNNFFLQYSTTEGLFKKFINSIKEDQFAISLKDKIIILDISVPELGQKIKLSLDLKPELNDILTNVYNKIEQLKVENKLQSEKIDQTQNERDEQRKINQNLKKENDIQKNIGNEQKKINQDLKKKIDEQTIYKMDSEKLKQFLEIVNGIKDIDEEKSEDIIIILKDTFKRFVLGEKNKVQLKELWFEIPEIKEDSDYYKIICSYIDIFISNFQDTKSFNLEKFCEEIVAISENNKYSIYYKLLLELYQRFGFEVDTELFYKIFCSLYCLGFKKESMVNKYLVENLIDFNQEEAIIKSGYDSYIKDFNYEKIDETFLKNLITFIDLILKNKPDKESIEVQIKILTNKKICKAQGNGSSSTSVTNTDNIENEVTQFDNNGNNSIENDINEKINNINNK